LQEDPLGVRHLIFRALGTDCQIKFRKSDERSALQFAAKTLEWVGAFEANYSRFRPDSIISRINDAAGRSWVKTNPETDRLLDIADELFTRTDGILDATMLPLLKVWNWKEVHERLPDKSRVAQALALTGWAKVERRQGSVFLPEEGMGLDFGGFGKELAVDAIVKLAKVSGVKAALIDFGRDVFAIGGNGAHPFWHIGIESGSQPGTCWGGLAVSDRAVSSSGNYARKFTHDGIEYGHILDPRTGWPVRNGMQAVTVVGCTCLEAGIYSTAIFVLGTEKGLQLASRTLNLDVCTQSEKGIDGTRTFGQWLVQAEEPTL
jgi:thiamine biosynthesis lipoprotein